MIYVLILFAHVGAFGDGNSNSLTTAEFSSKETCEVALKESINMKGAVVTVKGVCVKK